MVVDPAEQPFVAPAAEVAKCRAFGRQIPRDQAPGNAPVQHVEDGIQDLAGGPGSRATARGRLRHERGNHRPLRIRQVCFVTKAGAAMLPPGSRGPHGTSRSGFRTRLKAPPARPINPHSPLSGRALSTSQPIRAPRCLEAYKRYADMQGLYDVAHLRRDDISDAEYNRTHVQGYSVVSMESYRRAFRKFGYSEESIEWVSDDY